MLYIKYKYKERIRKMFTKFNVYFGLDKKPTKKDVAVKCYYLNHAKTQYLGFNNAYIKSIRS